MTNTNVIAILTTLTDARDDLLVELNALDSEAPERAEVMAKVATASAAVTAEEKRIAKEDAEALKVAEAAEKQIAIDLFTEGEASQKLKAAVEVSILHTISLTDIIIEVAHAASNVAEYLAAIAVSEALYTKHDPSTGEDGKTPQAFRNAKSVVKWAMVEGELKAGNGHKRNFNQIAKAKRELAEAGKTAVVGIGPNNGSKANTSGNASGSNAEPKPATKTELNADFKIAEQNIDVLFKKFQAVSAMIEAGDSDGEVLAIALHNGTAAALMAYHDALNLLAIKSEVEATGGEVVPILEELEDGVELELSEKFA